MKKVILFFSAMMFLVLSVSAEKEKEEEPKPIPIDFHPIGHGGFNTGVNRTLIEFPFIDVVYSYALNTIQVASDVIDNGEVYVYDNSGATVGYANTLNASILMPSVSGTYTIYITGTDWYALGYLNK